MAFDSRDRAVKLLMTRPNKIFPSSAVLSEGYVFIIVLLLSFGYAKYKEFVYSLFIWIEKIPDSVDKRILKSNMSGTDIESFIFSGSSNCNCSSLNPFDNVLTMYMSNNGKMKLLWIEGKNKNIIVSDINGCKCSVVFTTNSSLNLTSLAVDKHNIYWTTNKSMCSIKIKELNDTPMIENDTALFCVNNVTAVYTIDGLSDSSKSLKFRKYFLSLCF